MLKRLAVFALVTMVVAGALTGCSRPAAPSQPQQGPQQSQQPQQPAQRVRLSMGTATTGGLYYSMGGAWAKLLNENLKTVDVTAEVTGGSVANAQMIQGDKIHFGFSQATAAYEAYNGMGWTKGKKYDRVRGMIALYPGALTMYCLESKPIKKIQDLNGKIVGLGPAGAGVDAMGRNLFKALNIKPKQIQNLPHDQTIQAVRDGILDAAMVVQLAPWPGLMDLEATNAVRFIGITKEEAAKVVADFPYYSETIIPKGAYKGAKEDIITLGDWNLGIVDANLAADIVYDIVKTTFEKQKDLVAVHKAAEFTKPENVVYNTIPLHPGAYRYYKEKGIKIPENLVPSKQ